jgi:hypothetical protein
MIAAKEVYSNQAGGRRVPNMLSKSNSKEELLKMNQWNSSEGLLKMSKLNNREELLKIS